MTPLSEKELIARINQRFAFIESMGIIYDTENRCSMTDRAFARCCAELTCVNPKPAHELWWKSTEKRKYTKFLYHPSAACPTTVFNTHYGMAVSKRGSVVLWTRLMDSLYGKGTPERRYAEAWDLYPIAFPGAKLSTARVIWSPEPGVGKGAEATVLSYVYGPHNVSLVDDSSLNDKWNDWMIDKQLIVIPEANLNNEKLTERMKDWITDEVVRFRTRYIASHQGPTYANFLLHSNDADAVRLPRIDRRYHIHQVVGRGLADDPGFWLELLGEKGNPNDGGWAKAEAGALRYHADHFDFKGAGFDPSVRAPETEAKRSMMDDTGTPEEIFIARLRNDPRQVLGGNFRLFTTNALIYKYGKKTNPHRWPGWLREGGIQKIVLTDVNGIDGRSQIKIGGKMQTVWTSEPGLKLTAKATREEYKPITEQERIQGGNQWETNRSKNEIASMKASVASWDSLLATSKGSKQ